MKGCELLHAAHTGNTQTRRESLKICVGGVRERQQRDGRDNAVGIFVSNVEHLGNAVRHLRL